MASTSRRSRPPTGWPGSSFRRGRGCGCAAATPARATSRSTRTRTGVPTDALSDLQTESRPGSVNPFVAGNRRDLAAARPTPSRVLDQPRPAGARARPNTLYARTEDGSAIELFYRIYEPDRGLRPRRRHRAARARAGASGRIDRQGRRGLRRGERRPDRSIPQQTIPAALWQAGRNAPGCDGATNPAYEPVRWERFFNDRLRPAGGGARLHHHRAARSAARIRRPSAAGFYCNRDNAYIYAHLSRKFGPVLTLRGKLPTVPRTFDRQRRMEAAQLRFWSLCTGESRVTLRTPDCVADRERADRLPAQVHGRGLAGAGPARKRPPRAAAPPGSTGASRGDGAGDPDYAAMILRNMLPAAGFGQAVQRIRRPGTEADVMGDHFPATGYGTRAGFEARGCTRSALTLGRRLRVLRRGRRVRVRVSCRSYEVACSGRLVMRWGRRLVGRARFSVRSGTQPGPRRSGCRARGAGGCAGARRVVVRAGAPTPVGVPRLRPRQGYRGGGAAFRDRPAAATAPSTARQDLRDRAGPRRARAWRSSPGGRWRCGCASAPRPARPEGADPDAAAAR